MTQTPTIEFLPNEQGHRGGEIVLYVALTGQQVYDAYLNWLKGQPGRRREMAWDEQAKELHIGEWTFSIVESLQNVELDFQPTDTVVDYEAETQPLNTIDLRAALVKAPAEQTKVDAKEVARILTGGAQLKIARVFSRDVLDDHRKMVEQSSVTPSVRPQGIAPTNTGFQQVSGASSFQPVETGGFSAPTRLPASRLVITNEPEKQLRPAAQTPQQHESNMNKRRREERETKQERPQTPRYQKPSSAGTGRPADLDMINRLVSQGIGSEADHLGTFASGLKDRLRQRERRNNDPATFEDGVNCINISAAAQTELGKRLRLSTQRPFTYPHLGSFQSLAGLFLMLTENPCQDSYATIHSNRANKPLYSNHDYQVEYQAALALSKQDLEAGVKAYYDLRVIYKVMGDALWMTVNQDVELVADLLNNKLEFQCYSLLAKRKGDPGQDEPPPRRFDAYGRWYLPLLIEVVRCLRQRYGALKRNVPTEKLPLPDFNQVVEKIIQRQRRQMSKYMERRQEGYATPVDQQAHQPADVQAQQPQQGEGGDMRGNEFGGAALVETGAFINEQPAVHDERNDDQSIDQSTAVQEEGPAAGDPVSSEAMPEVQVDAATAGQGSVVSAAGPVYDAYVSTDVHVTFGPDGSSSVAG